MWQIRQLLALAMLAICAYTDIKEKNIYVMPLVITGTGAVIISLVSMMAKGTGHFEILTEYIILPAVTGLLAIFISRALQGHIGAGDALLLGTLGLVTGIRTDIASFAVSMIVASIYAVIVLILPKRRIIRSIPFAPFVMTGYVMVLVNEI